MKVPEWIRERFPADGGQSPTWRTALEREQWLAEQRNQGPGHLTGYACAQCQNRGYFHRVDDQGRRYLEECRCMSARRSLARMARSGLGELLERYTLETWQEREAWQRRARELAQAYAEGPEGWFVMAGPPGTGKTHLCTALCGVLMERGLDVRYLLWREVSVQAKAAVNDAGAYARIVEPLKQAQCLYIDDLFKTGGGRPTAGDVNLAFELLNSRYNSRRKPTILSTQMSAEGLVEIDEALGSRIYERAKGRYLDLSGKKNWRLEG